MQATKYGRWNRKVWLLITIYATSFSFSLHSFLGGNRKGEWSSKNRDQKSYLSGPSVWYLGASVFIIKNVSSSTSQKKLCLYIFTSLRLSLRSLKVTKGHFYVYFNLKLHSYGQLFVLVFYILYEIFFSFFSKEVLKLYFFIKTVPEILFVDELKE